MAGDILAGLAEALASGSVEVVDLAQPLEPSTPVISLPPQFGQSAPFRSMERISDYDESRPRLGLEQPSRSASTPAPISAR